MFPFCDGEMVNSFFDGEMGKVGRVTEMFFKVGQVTEIFSKVGRVTKIFSCSKTCIVSISFKIYNRCMLLPCSWRHSVPCYRLCRHPVSHNRLWRQPVPRNWSVYNQ